MRTLPHNIYRHPDGLIVMVERRRVKYRAFVGFRKSAGAIPEAALARAIELRDRFISLAGDGCRSNTGHMGISETVVWGHRWNPQSCLTVNWRRGGRNFNRRIFFGECRPYEVAMQQAIELRRRMAGTSARAIPSRQQTQLITNAN